MTEQPKNPRRDSLGRRRTPEQDAANRRHPHNCESNLVRIVTDSDTTAWFKELSPRDRGLLLEGLRAKMTADD